MQIWRREFSESQFNMDTFNLVFGIIEHLLVPFRLLLRPIEEATFPQKATKLSCLFLAVGGIHLAIVGRLLVRKSQRSWAARHRNKVLLIHFFTRIIEYYFLVIRTQVFLLPQPMTPPGQSFLAAAHHMYHPLLQARMSLGFLLPLELRHLVAFTQLGVLAHQSVGRCAAEVAGLPGQGEQYKRTVIAIENALYKWLPIPAFRGGAADSLLADQLSATGACVAVKNYLQVRAQ